jgi:hypothetical protein
MKMTLNGKLINLNGNVGYTILGRQKIGFGSKAVEISFDESKKTASFTEINQITKESFIHEMEKIESVTEYDRSVYIYGFNSINGNKIRFVFEKAS